jgi:hypothetical protein
MYSSVARIRRPKIWPKSGQKNFKAALKSCRKKWLNVDLAKWLERLTAKVNVATVLGSIPASSKKWNMRGGDEAVLKEVL